VERAPPPAAFDFAFLADASLSAAKNGGHQAWTAAVQNGNDGERFLIRRVGNYIIAYSLKPQRFLREVGSAVAYVRKRDKGLDRFVDFFTDTIGGVEAVGSDVFPDFVEIGIGLRVENKSAHEATRL
jgi:hypothetical protein